MAVAYAAIGYGYDEGFGVTKAHLDPDRGVFLLARAMAKHCHLHAAEDVVTTLQARLASGRTIIDLQHEVIESLRDSHERLADTEHDSEKSFGEQEHAGHCALVSVVIVPPSGGVEIIHVGNVRAYHLPSPGQVSQDRDLRRLTQDHTVQIGNLEVEVINRAIGWPEFAPEVSVFPDLSGAVLICTEGVTEALTDTEILKLWLEVGTSALCKALIHRVREKFDGSFICAKSAAVVVDTEAHPTA